jgi:hypothetical protein
MLSTMLRLPALEVCKNETQSLILETLEFAASKFFVLVFIGFVFQSKCLSWQC